MFRFLKKYVFTAMAFFSCNTLMCVSVNNQECKIRSEIIGINRNEPLFCPYNIEVNKCSGGCDDISDPYAKLCVHGVAKNINVKAFNLISRTDETRHIKWHETCKCKCRLDPSVCNNKQRWNNDKGRCECKELIDNGRCDERFIWNLSNCECKCDKLCEVGEPLDYKNCKYRKRLIDNLVEENIDGN